ncbi:hypothetical protein ACFXPT_39135 [Streptomyces goshikiensis]|uniref:hypothetical protein n=1 Tax=Streptomyces goshikiensis TaxID=1942 RepID=UPI0036A55A7B
MVDEEGAELARSELSDERSKKISRILLERILSPQEYAPKEYRLIAEELKEGSDLRARWIDDENHPTEAGLQRLSRLGWGPGGANRAAMELSLQTSSEIEEEPLSGESLKKGDIVVQGHEFNLAADTSPSGGSNLEWVTKPLHSKDEVGRVMDRITEMADYLNQQFSLGHRTFVPSEELTQGGAVPVPYLRIYPFQGELSFAPQVTAGMRLDRFPELLEYLTSDPAQADMGLWSRLRLGFNGVRQRMEARSDLYSSVNNIKAARSGAENSVNSLAKSLRLDSEERSSVMGLAAHLAGYLMEAEALADGANSKSIAGGLMARTDFSHNFSLLPERVRTYFQQQPEEFSTLVLDAAGMLDGGGRRIFPNAVERGLAGERIAAEITLTRNKWLTGIPQGMDLLKNWENLTPEQQSHVEEASARGVHKSLGALGSVEDRIHAADERRVMVAEFRRMRDRRPSSELKPLALAVFGFIDGLNRGKALSYRK